MGTLVQDVRYGLRNLARNPGFALVAMLTLALGIGANTTVFSVINNTLLKPLAFPGADRLVLVWETFGKGPDNWNIVSAPNFWDFERQSHSFERMAIFDSAGRGYNLSAAGARQEAEQVSGLRVTAGFFSVLGVKPFLGRTFLPEEETLGRDREVVLSYGLWKTRYGGDPSLVGRTIRIDGADFTVIGVMPRDFDWQFWSAPRQLWVPVGYTKTDFGRGDNSFIAIARLKPGVSVAQARAEMEAVGSNVQRQNPKEDADMGATVSPLGEYGMEGLRTTMLTLLAAVAFVLLIACVNVANLLLARGAARQKEFAIRRALGAAGSRIARQLLTESILLALAGGVAGLLLAAWSTRMLFYAFKLDSLYLPLRAVDSIPMDGRVFAICAAGFLPDRPAVRRGAGVERAAHRHQRAPEGRRAQRRYRRPQPSAPGAGGVRSGAGAGGAFGRRPDDQEHDATAGRRSGAESEKRADPGDVGSAGRDLRGAAGAAALLPGSRRARGRHSRRGFRRRGGAFAFSRKRRPGFPDRRPAAGGPGKTARRELHGGLPELLPDHGHSDSEGAGIHDAGYGECAGRDRDQRDDGARVLAQGRSDRQSDPAGRIRRAAPDDRGGGRGCASSWDWTRPCSASSSGPTCKPDGR